MRADDLSRLLTHLDAGPAVVLGSSGGAVTSTALAAALGVESTMFPGGHIGFVEDPDGFAIRLRAVLREN